MASNADWRRWAQPKDGTKRIAAKGGPLSGGYLRIHPDVEIVPFETGHYQLVGDHYVWRPTLNNEKES